MDCFDQRAGGLLHTGVSAVFDISQKILHLIIHIILFTLGAEEYFSGFITERQRQILQTPVLKGVEVPPVGKWIKGADKDDVRFLQFCAFFSGEDYA